MNIHSLLNQFNEKIIVRSQRIIEHSKAQRLPVPKEYLKKFPNIKPGTKWDVSISEDGALIFFPLIKEGKMEEYKIETQSDRLRRFKEGNYLQREIKESK